MAAQLVLQDLFEGNKGVAKVTCGAELVRYDPSGTQASMEKVEGHPSIKAALRLGFMPEGMTHTNYTAWDSESDPVVSCWSSKISAFDWFQAGGKKHLQDLVERKRSTEVLLEELNSIPSRQAYMATLGKVLQYNLVQNN